MGSVHDESKVLEERRRGPLDAIGAGYSPPRTTTLTNRFRARNGSSNTYSDSDGGARGVQPLSSMLAALQNGIKRLGPSLSQKQSKWEREVQRLRQEQEQLEQSEPSLLQRTPPRSSSLSSHVQAQEQTMDGSSKSSSGLPVASERRAGRDVVERASVH